jgi:hypothetical protein
MSVSARTLSKIIPVLALDWSTSGNQHSPDCIHTAVAEGSSTGRRVELAARRIAAGADSCCDSSALGRPLLAASDVQSGIEERRVFDGVNKRVCSDRA